MVLPGSKLHKCMQDYVYVQLTLIQVNLRIFSILQNFHIPYVGAFVYVGTKAAGDEI